MQRSLRLVLAIAFCIGVGVAEFAIGREAPMASFANRFSRLAWEQECAHPQWFCRLPFSVEGIDWVLVDVNTNPSLGIVDFLTLRGIHRQGAIVTVWEREEHSAVTSDSPYESLMEQLRFDCKQGMQQVSYVVLYPESNLNGSPVAQNHVFAWEPIIPGSIGGEERDWACSRDPAASD